VVCARWQAELFDVCGISELVDAALDGFNVTGASGGCVCAEQHSQHSSGSAGQLRTQALTGCSRSSAPAQGMTWQTTSTAAACLGRPDPCLPAHAPALSALQCLRLVKQAAGKPTPSWDLAWQACRALMRRTVLQEQQQQAITAAAAAATAAAHTRGQRS
jgi:hypothetical protein